MNSKYQREPIDGVKFSEILYADDTLIFGTVTFNINKLLRRIQEESKYYNMNLNIGKCINISINQKQTSVKYQNNEKVPGNKRAVYLGTILTDENDNKTEISNRIADSTAVANKIKSFWNKAENDEQMFFGL